MACADVRCSMLRDVASNRDDSPGKVTRPHVLAVRSTLLRGLAPSIPGATGDLRRRSLFHAPSWASTRGLFVPGKVTRPRSPVRRVARGTVRIKGAAEFDEVHQLDRAEPAGALLLDEPGHLIGQEHRRPAQVIRETFVTHSAHLAPVAPSRTRDHRPWPS